jgi:hypothetical protein
MRQLLAVTAMALAIATPAFAADGMSSNPDMQQAIAKAEAYRLNQEAQKKAAQHATVGKGASATEAAIQGGQASRPDKGQTDGR